MAAPVMNERNCRRCGTWHRWTGEAPVCWCGMQVKPVTMRPQQVTREKLAEARANSPARRRRDLQTRRCECSRWHTYFAVGRMTCVCGRRVPPVGQTASEIRELRAEDARVLDLIISENDMEGTMFNWSH